LGEEAEGGGLSPFFPVRNREGLSGEWGMEKEDRVWSKQAIEKERTVKEAEGGFN